MSDWTFATGDALTRKAYAKKFWIEAKTESYFYAHGFVGKGEENIIVEYPDLEKDQGDQITFGQIRELSGAGVANDGTMEGNEEAPLVYDDAIVISQIRNAVRTNGAETEQRSSDAGLRAWAKELLNRWMAAQIDQTIFTALGSSCTKVIYGGDATATSDIEAGDYMTLALIGKVAAYAKKANPLIVGPTYKGKKLNGVVIMSPDQAYDLTERDAAWGQGQREANVSGESNPIFTDALGMKKNLVLHDHPRIAISAVWGSGNNLPGATALALGIQSGAIAYAKKKIWDEKTFDYGNKVGFCVGALYGFTKAVFNSADNAVVGIATYRTSN
jgi:N4-gp56 family major capsid protein